MKSMTGYGRGDSSAKGVQLAVEISSVNRRQVEVAVSLPNELDSLEADLRKIVLSSVARGRISGRVTLQRPSGKSSGKHAHERHEYVCVCVYIYIYIHTYIHT